MDTTVAAPGATGVQQVWTASSASARRYLRTLLAIGAANTVALFVAPLAAIRGMDALGFDGGAAILSGIPVSGVIVGLVVFAPMLALYWRLFAKTLVVSSLTVEPDGVTLEYLGGQVESLPWRRVKDLKLYRDRDGRARFVALTYRDKAPTFATKAIHLPDSLYEIDGVWTALESAAPENVLARHGRFPFTSIPRAAGMASASLIALVTATATALCLLL